MAAHTQKCTVLGFNILLQSVRNIAVLFQRAQVACTNKKFYQAIKLGCLELLNFKYFFFVLPGGAM